MIADFNVDIGVPHNSHYSTIGWGEVIKNKGERERVAGRIMFFTHCWYHLLWKQNDHYWYFNDWNGKLSFVN